MQLHFCLVDENHLSPHLRALSQQFPAVKVDVNPAHGTLSVSLSSAQAEQLEGFQKALLQHFGNYHYNAPSGKIEEALLTTCVKNKKKVVFAESCTGGAMASHVTSIAGASDYFLGSFVVYSNAMKEQILGVSAQTLASKGAVSEEVVKEMLAGVFERTSADYAVAVSGIAGPTGGTKDKPVGTVWAAVGERGKTPDVGQFRCGGNRERVILVAANTLLGALWRKVEKGIPAFPLIN